MHRHDRPRDIAFLLTMAALTAALSAQGTPIGFEETYALSTDRAKAVATLVQGSEEWFFYHCRERLDARDFATVRTVLPQWIQAHGRNGHVIEIENRLALLSFTDDPNATWSLLRERLGLQFQHQRVVPGEPSNLPTRLDPTLLSPTRLSQRALSLAPGTVEWFTNHALWGLAQTNLDADTLHNLLGRLDRPDVDNLPALIVRDLQHPQSQRFGSLPIHRMLRRAQLEECARLRPQLLQERAFVDVWLACLAPSADVAWQIDPTLRGRQLARLWEFVQRLPSSHNSLKAHVLHHWLQHDLTQGAPDRDRFLAYIRLPRRSGHPAEAYLRQHARAADFVDGASAYPTGLPAIGDDEALVRACLEHFFQREDGYEAWAEFLDADWLKGVFAETKLLTGQGDAQRWFALLADPGRVDHLEQRVEIAFPPTQKTVFAGGDAVTLEVDTKNVPTLLVKVFAIDAYRYHQEKQSEVDATIDLDGVVANFEQTFNYTEPKMHRVRRVFDLPMLTQPGTYVVEFVGNGLSSRAVVHKGGLRHAQHTTAAGHAFKVYDEAGVLLKDANLWFGGREYAADADGEILLPFTTEPGRHKVVLHQGSRSSIGTFDHRAEAYRLAAGVHVDRESLIAGRKAKLIVRPQLLLADRDVPLKLLTQPVLTIVATDLDGVQTTQEVRDPQFVDFREFAHEIAVPERLASLSVVLRGRVRDLAGKDVDLASEAASFALNGVDATPATSAVMLVPTANGFVLEVRGKDGEPKVGQVCQLALAHRDYRETVDVALQTDDAGRITLGDLKDVLAIRVRQPSGFEGVFQVPRRQMRLPTALHGTAGETLRIPYQGGASTPTRAEFSLLGTERDEFSRLAIADGFLELRDLPADDYVLRLFDTEQAIAVRVTKGTRERDWMIGADRMLAAASPATPLQVRGIEVAGEELVVRLANPTGATRLLIAASRFAPTFSPFDDLFGASSGPDDVTSTDRAESSYQSGRQLGDEYRYVLERRFAAKFPGNMLQRPSLLLNPWRLDEDSRNAAIGLGGGGGDKFGALRQRRGAGPGGATSGSAGAGRGAPLAGTWANLDWLPDAMPQFANLAPDANGVVRVKLADLGTGHVVHVLAIDGTQAVYDSFVRAEQPVQPRTRHLSQALDGASHFVQQKRIEFVGAGGEAVLGDARSAQVEVYDSLAAVHRLLSTICRDESLSRFAFVLQWPTYDAARKRELYSQHACHELSFFLYRKDPEFFAAVIKPLLANKLDKTFLDHWLLGDDLRGWLEPWRFAHLNLIERILLAQRLDGDQQKAVARTVREAIEVRPPSIDHLDRLFGLALRANELADRDRGDVQELLLKEVAANAPPRPAAAAPAPPAGPTTGGPGDHKDDRAAGATKKPAEHKAKDQADEPAADGKPMQEERAARLQDAEEAEKTRADFERGLDKRAEIRRFYRAVEPTHLLVEHNWWHRRLQETTPDVVAANRFWLEWATAPAGQPFASAAVIEASGSFLEAMMALAVIDLPFTAGKHEVAAEGDRRTLRPATPLLLVRKEVAKAELAAGQTPLLIGENFFRLDDRYRYVDGEQRDAFVTDEFLTDVAYGCQVVVTNPTSQKRTTELLLQIPAGALPLQRGFWTKSVPVELAPYATATIEYAFYFPGTGTFAHYPVHAAEKGKLAAFAEPRSLRVVDKPSKVDTTSWEHVSQQGTAAEVLTHLDSANVLRLDLTKVAWRMRDKGFFAALLGKLRARHAYDDTLWSYGVMHQDVDATREYLRHADGFLAGCGMAIESPLVSIDPIERGTHQQVELDPLVHQRAHQLGSKRMLGNQDLARQYGSLLTMLGYKPTLDPQDWLTVTYYLLLQDRVEDALATFAKVDPAKVATRLQYDYLQSYLCFFTGDTGKARATAERYRDYPVPHWQKRFADVLAQLDEAEGKRATATGELSADALAATAPAIELAIDGRKAKVAFRNLKECEVRYYELDVEFAFSAQPFASEQGSSAAFVRPNQQQMLALPAGQNEVAFDLPAEFAQKNVLVEIRAGGLVRAQKVLANALSVRFLESYGQVAVTEPGTDKPLPKTYVKVFAKLADGSVRFHKDGYTDLRGRFDYASLSDDPNRGAMRYAVLVLDDKRGAVIREINPPVK